MEMEEAAPPDYSEKDSEKDNVMDDIDEKAEAPQPTEGWEESKPGKSEVIIAALVR